MQQFCDFMHHFAFSNTLTNPSLLLVFAVEAGNGAMTISNSGTAETWTDCGPGLVSDTVNINSIKCWYARLAQTCLSMSAALMSPLWKNADSHQHGVCASHG